MPRASRSLLRLFFAALCLALGGSSGAQLPRPSDVVEPRGYVSLQPVPRGRAFEVAVVAKIRPGFHINAHKVTEDYLIATTLDAQLPAGFRKLDTFHPPGVLRSFPYAGTKLAIYEGTVTLRMKLHALADAPLGPRKLLLSLRYQPCSEDACLPPVTVSIPVEFEVAPERTPARPLHQAIFESPGRPKTRPAR